MNTIDYRDYQLKKTSRQGESCEWGSLSNGSSKENLPYVLMIGDSICGGYNSRCSRLLNENANFRVWISSKCVTDMAYLRELDFIIDAMPRVDYITYNNGLHCTTSDRAEWKEAYSLVIDYLRAKCPDVKIHILTSTPCENEDFEKDVIKINESTVAVAAEKGLPVIDLHQTVMDMPSDSRWSDGIHYIDKASDILSDTIVDVLCKAYGWTKKNA